MANRTSIRNRLALKHKIGLGSFLMLFIAWLFCLPKLLFDDPASTVVLSSDHVLVGARIAEDGQWRFPELDSVPYRFEQSVLLFEDEYFYHHPGFNPVSIFKAIQHNLTKDSRRGGSTITQQVIRLSRKNKTRTYWEKGIELFFVHPAGTAAFQRRYPTALCQPYPLRWERGRIGNRCLALLWHSSP